MLKLHLEDFKNDINQEDFEGLSYACSGFTGQDL